MNDDSLSLDRFITNAIHEDIGDGDHTSLACVQVDEVKSARLLAKDQGVAAGIEIALKIFAQIDPDLKTVVHIHDGNQIYNGDVIFDISGNSRSILKAERLVLNCMQRMSGIATKTRNFVELVKDFNCKILDTRKTTPGFRALEKMAVRLGGGYNHRFGLYDMIMIKDNHIDFAGGIEMAIHKTRNYLNETGKSLKIEIEARDIDEVRQILACGQIDRIMLDNFSYDDMREAVKLIDGKYETEASGGIDETTVAKYAACGVDFISVGALTHQINSLDLSLIANI